MGGSIRSPYFGLEKTQKINLGLRLLSYGSRGVQIWFTFSKICNSGKLSITIGYINDLATHFLFKKPPSECNSIGRHRLSAQDNGVSIGAP